MEGLVLVNPDGYLYFNRTDKNEKIPVKQWSLPTDWVEPKERDPGVLGNKVMGKVIREIPQISDYHDFTDIGSNVHLQTILSTRDALLVWGVGYLDPVDGKEKVWREPVIRPKGHFMSSFFILKNGKELPGDIVNTTVGGKISDWLVKVE